MIEKGKEGSDEEEEEKGREMIEIGEKEVMMKGGNEEGEI